MATCVSSKLREFLTTQRVSGQDTSAQAKKKTLSFSVTRNEGCQRKDRARANELEFSAEERMCQAHFQRMGEQHA